MQCFLGHSSCSSYTSQDSPPQCGLTVLIIIVLIRLHCLGHLLNFGTLKVGAYLRRALIGGWALIKFSTFSASVVCLFCNKTVTVNNKMRRCKVSVKYSEENSVFGEVSYQYFFNSLGVGEGKGVGTYLSFRGSEREVGWGWALIRGWALINIFCLQDGHLFKVGTNQRLGTCSNKHGNMLLTLPMYSQTLLIRTLREPLKVSVLSGSNLEKM